jgi:thioredoxin-like negative regulator of GroEL
MEQTNDIELISKFMKLSKLFDIKIDNQDNILKQMLEVQQQIKLLLLTNSNLHQINNVIAQIIKTCEKTINTSYSNKYRNELPTLIFFYKSTNDSSTKIMDTWAKIKLMYVNKINLVEIDSDVKKENSFKFGIFTFPSFKIYANGITYTFDANSEKAIDELILFIEKNIK